MFSKQLAQSLIKKSLLFFVVLIVFTFGMMNFCFAESQAQTKALEGLETSGASMKSTGAVNVLTIISKAISFLITILGVYFLVSLVRAGFMWMTAGGEVEDVTKAKKIIFSSAIGMIICIGAYSISSYVVGSVANLMTKQ